jgi:hypothetical protein
MSKSRIDDFSILEEMLYVTQLAFESARVAAEEFRQTYSAETFRSDIELARTGLSWLMVNASGQAALAKLISDRREEKLHPSPKGLEAPEGPEVVEGTAYETR